MQTGIYYCPGLEFYAFDIATVSSGSKSKGNLLAPFFSKFFLTINADYMNYDKAMDVFKKCNFFFAEPLLIG